MRVSFLHFTIVQIALILGSIPASSQVSETGAHADASPYLLRLERMQPDRDSCILVRRNGDYHYERLLAHKMDIYEGTLAAEDIQLLQQALTREALRGLSQDKINEPGLHKLDDLYLSISREGGWQNLKLLGVEGRAPYRELIDPLLTILEKVPREKRVRLSEDAGRNNCMPPGNIRLAQRPAAPNTSGSDKRSLLMRLRIADKSEYKLTNTCVLAYQDGHYHQERSNQRPGSVNAEVRVSEGSLGEGAVQQLRVLLENPAFQKRPDKPPTLNFPVRSAEIILLSVPQEGRLHEMAFWQYVGAERLGSVYTPPHSDNGTKLVTPLREWIDANLSTASGTELPTSGANHCNISE